MKKIATILVAVAMLCMMAVPALAAESTYTLTITGAAGHTYDVYQIFTGDISIEGEKTVLSNIKYGENYGTKGNDVGQDVLDAIKQDAQTAVDLIYPSLKGTPVRDDLSPADDATEIVIRDLAPGYYMIVDVTASLPEGQTKSPVMLQIVEDVTVASKHSEITSEKKVDDKNDSNNSEDAVVWQDSADYDIGDDVPFKISATIPVTFSTYDDYTITFHDEQAAGFDAPVISKVYILQADGTEITVPMVDGTVTNGYKMQDCSSDTCEFSGCDFTVVVGDINDLYGTYSYTVGDQIVIEYTAKLNDQATVGRDGNENGMYVCHPDGHTPEDYVIVFTYDLTVNKIDGATKDPLKGAGFTLYKWDYDTSSWVAVGPEVTGTELTEFKWSGIDDGRYKLEETTTPSGYNTMADLEFYVTAAHKESWIKGGNSAFEDLIAKDPSGNTIVFADADANSAEDGKLEGKLENNKGTVLPETGAMGTMIFVTTGTLLATAAVVVMVSRKKMSIYED